MRFAIQPFSRWYLDAQELFRAHWAEIARHQERFALDPEWRRFIAAEFEGRLFSVTVRDGGRLVGYAVFLFGPHLHYSGMRAAVCDMIYIAPGHRALGLAYRSLVRFCDAELAARGAHITLHREKIAHPAFSLLLARDGYSPVETVLEKVH